jgi:AcrR family transcriptional regulator
MREEDGAELRIKEAARQLFQEKGFDGVRTREIAEKAGINSALLHYYFRSKEKLFRIIMNESIREMFAFLQQIINEPSTSLSYKIDEIVNGYLNVVLATPNLVLFVLNELHANPKLLIRESKVPHRFLNESYLSKQIAKHLEANSIAISPLHIVMNMISLTVMPVIASPMAKHLYDVDDENFRCLIEERRKLIPLWIKGMMKIEE